MSERLEPAKSERFDLFNLNISDIWFSLKQKKKTHDYTAQTLGIEYLFESFNQGMQGYMTGQGKKVTPGESILLSIEGNLQKYEVKEIDYYSWPEDMWIARLVKVNHF